MDAFSTLAGTDHFHLRDDQLWCEGVRVADLAAAHGTPLYVYSRAAMAERYARVRAAFGRDAHVCYAVKANSNLGVLRTFRDLGAGFDLVSRGELRRLQAAGIDTRGAVFAGVAKDKDDIGEALAAGILFFNVESPHELPLLAAAGKARGVRVPLALRLNPDVDAGTHAYISTGKSENKFGLDLRTASMLVAEIRRTPQLELVGYHVHLGSQLKAAGPYLEALTRVEAFLDADASHRQGLRFHDLGGGFGVGYGDPGGLLDVEVLAAAVLPRLRARGLVPVVEPGRFLIADAGVLVTRVLGTKAGVGRDFVLVDAAMNDLIRPSLYEAEHPIAPLRRPTAPPAARPCDVVGPVCESSDFLGLHRRLPSLAKDDLLAVFSTGAYGASMTSNYNSRRRPAEVMVAGEQVTLLRRRERFEDLWAAELS